MARIEGEDKYEATVPTVQEGCNIGGSIRVAKLPGVLKFSMGQQLPAELRMFQLFAAPSQNVTHVVHRLAFGQPFPGMRNPMDGTVARATNTNAGAFKYYNKVVRTIYESLRHGPITSAQYSSTQFYSETDGASPGVVINYDVSPIMHRFQEKRTSFADFIVNSCAIVGGTFAVCGLVDSLLHHSQVDIVGLLLGSQSKHQATLGHPGGF